MNRLSDRAVETLRETMRLPALPDRYRLDAVLGQGGMGVVWRCRDLVLDRDVAIKLLADHIDDESLVVRLNREARILARLEHPGIVPIHDAGTLQDGSAWYAMRLVDGARLDEAAAGFGSLGEALRVMIRIVETVAYAHARGILHRDLTPRNVMLGPFGEILILDWGLASDGPVEPGVMGTPGYMAPEQSAGLAADARTDVHGLGAILRDLIAASQEPAPPPLFSIRDRALAVEAEDRYPDAGAMRDDLTSFLDGKRVAAHHERPMEALARVTRPYRFAIGLVLAYLVMRLAVLWWKGI